MPRDMESLNRSSVERVAATISDGSRESLFRFLKASGQLAYKPTRRWFVLI